MCDTKRRKSDWTISDRDLAVFDRWQNKKSE